MTDKAMPYSVNFDLDALSERGAELRLQPNETERAAIAEWLGISKLESFSAVIRLSRAGENRYRYEARFAAAAVQACVVTLEPVPATLEGEVTREFFLAERASSRRKSASLMLTPDTMNEDEPDVLATPILDVAAPLLEELSLSLDPYPRAAGAAFEEPARDEPKPASPFAILGELKLNLAQSEKAPAVKNRSKKPAGKP
jgi:hypothetical protein